MMKHYLLLLLAGLCTCAPVEQGGMQTGSCQDAMPLNAAGLALTKINEDRKEGYIFSLHRLSNVNMMTHGESGLVFYLTLDVLETDCHILSKKAWKTCEARPTHDTPVYGQCKATIYINRVNRVVRLYNYKCTIRPVPAARVALQCPDCPSHMDMDNAEIVKASTLSLEKFNKESSLSNHFALLKITRATAQMGMAVFYNVEYTVQETSCAQSTDAAQAAQCPLMGCEFAHKGLCKGSHSHSHGEEHVDVECEIFEPEASIRENKTHLLGGETDHSHDNTNAGATDNHDHTHDHTTGHATHTHAENSEHHHEHDHGDGTTHSHDHSHDHGHGHDHVHTHHAKAHDHSGDLPNQHHSYHGADGSTHAHDHELALDHDHKHTHLHAHEHHHHHHEHEHESHRHAEGMVIVLPALGLPMTLPAFPDQPVAGPEVGVTLPLIPDPQIPGMMEPTIEAFPATMSPDCPAPLTPDQASSLVAMVFSEDPEFKASA